MHTFSVPVRVRATMATFVLGALIACMSPSPAHASERLDVREWLRRPGVRLVAVEFYATWCEPCMKAVPKWKELHEQYRSQGLRLVVINTLDPEGGCVHPGWNPNDLICDDEGLIGERMGVGQRLPAAFLWSWQGNLLVRKGHVGDVRQAVERYLRDMPRVAIQVSEAPNAEQLADRVRARLSETGKLQVVAGDDEQKMLDAIRRKSQNPRFDDKLGCEAGKEVPANSLLKVAVRGSTRKSLSLTLQAADTGCVLTSVSVDWNAAKARMSVAEAVDELVGRLRRDRIEMPGTGAGTFGGAAERTVGRLFLHVDADDVSYRIDGTKLKGRLRAGQPKAVELPLQQTPYHVILSKDGYHAYDAVVKLDGGEPVVTVDHVMMRKVAAAESSGQGWLVVKSTPENAQVEIDGVKQRRRTPATFDLSAGPHAVRIHRAMYRDWTGQITLPPDGSKEIAETLTPDFARLAIRAEPAGAEIFLNDKRVGAGAYDQPRQPSGAYELRITAPLHASVEETLYVKPGVDLALQKQLRPRYGALALEVVTEVDDGSDARPRLFLDGAPVSVTFRSEPDGDGHRFTARLERIASGDHDLEVQLARFGPHVADITIRDGQTTEQEAVLSARFATLRITSDPSGAKVALDGRSVGTTPLTRHTDIGNHEVVVEHAEAHYRLFKRNLVVRAEASATVHAELELITGGLSIGSQPPDAEVFVDGQRRGRSPLRLESLPVGVRKIEARHAGWTPKVMEVAVREGQHRRVLIELDQLGTIEVRCATPGSDGAGVQVSLGGVTARGPSHLFQRLQTGDYQAVCRSPDGHEARMSAHAAPSRHEVIELDLTAPEVLLEAWESEKAGYQLWGGVLLGVAGAGAVVAAVTTGLAFEQDSAAQDAYGDFVSATDDAGIATAAGRILDHQERRDDLMMGTWTSLGVAGVLAAAGTVLFLVAPDAPEAAVHLVGDAGAGVTVLPVMTPDGQGAGVSLRGGF